MSLATHGFDDENTAQLTRGSHTYYRPFFILSAKPRSEHLNITSVYSAQLGSKQCNQPNGAPLLFQAYILWPQALMDTAQGRRLTTFFSYVRMSPKRRTLRELQKTAFKNKTAVQKQVLQYRQTISVCRGYEYTTCNKRIQCQRCKRAYIATLFFGPAYEFGWSNSEAVICRGFHKTRRYCSDVDRA